MIASKGEFAVLRSRRGFTLVEVMVVLAIMAAMVGGGAVLVGLLDAGKLRSEAVTITSACKYTYSQAAVNNTRYRIVFDLDTGSYSTEVVRSARVEEPVAPAPGLPGAFGESQPARDESEFLTEEAQALAEKKEREDDLFDEAEDNPFGVNRRVTYERVQDGVIKPGKLPAGVKFKRIVVGNGVDREEGRASVSFFPNGFQEPAIRGAAHHRPRRGDRRRLLHQDRALDGPRDALFARDRHPGRVRAGGVR